MTTREEQRDVAERLDDDDLETIVACIKNGQPGRVTPYEIKAMCEELIRLRASQAGGVPANDALRSKPDWHDDPVEQLAFELAFELEDAGMSQNDYVTVNREKLTAIARRVLARASPPPPATDGDALRKALDRIYRWLLCAPLTSAEDMASSFPAMARIAEDALASSPPLAATEMPLDTCNSGPLDRGRVSSPASERQSEYPTPTPVSATDAVEAERAKWAAEVAEISNRLRVVEKIQGRVRADEREACIRAVQSIHQYGEYGEGGQYIIDTAVEAIRARGTENGEQS